MESRHILAALLIMWVATAFISIYAPEMNTAGGESIPITSWATPVCAMIATFFVVRWRKKD